jgi:hypothetical protein
MLVWRWLTYAAALAVLAAAAGCSRDSGSYAQVSGVVTFNGSPIDGAKVTFYSTVESGGEKIGPYSATTDSSGKYLIASVGKQPGVPPGMYKVTIVKLDVRPDNVPAEGWDEGQIEASGMGKNTLPKDYERLATTKLSVTLEAGKNENKDFNLKGQPSGTTPVHTP